MDFKDAILLQSKIHNNFAPQDAVKLSYQAAFGPSHMLNGIERAKEFLQKECKGLQAMEEPLWEEVSHDLVRLNLRSWVKDDLPVAWLFKLFFMTAEQEYKGETAFLEYISLIRELSQEGNFPFSREEFDAWYEAYLSGGIRAVSHSEGYRNANKPAYRLISRKYLNLIPVLKALYENSDIRVIAIDGMAGAGKTTLANNLKKVLECDLISMDDFFLPLEFRTRERLGEAGGNIYYERFMEEVIPHIRKEHAFSYRKFDCSIMEYGENVPVNSGRLRIVEGSYSCHPAFGDYADLRIFVETDPKRQMDRISKRNIPVWMVEKFRDRWIPMENRYHKAFDVPGKAHIVMKT